ncbi:MAG: SH3 domain-containing protein [Anaerolineales bacterium]|nr:SH3 domain-containing protein [Anaerolineales bacterium]
MNVAQRIATLGLVAGGLAACRSGAALTTATPSPAQVFATAAAIAELTQSAVTPTPTLSPNTATPEAPTVTPTLAASATPDRPILTALYNAYVRSGPDEVYPNVDFILQNQTAEVVGRYDNLGPGTSAGPWWLVRRIGGGLDGWVFGGAVTVGGNVNFVPAVDPPPTPAE